MAGQDGFKTETGYGVIATPDQFVPVLPGTAADVTVELMRPAGIGTRTTERPGVPGKRTGKGKTNMELPNLSVAPRLRHMFGTVVTTGPVSGLYTHTFTTGPLLGLSFTEQVGVQDAADVVRPFTAYGCKMDGWQVTADVGAFGMLSYDYTAKDVALHRAVADGATNTSTAITSATAAFTKGDVGLPISGTGIPALATIASVQSATAATLSAAATATATGVTFTLGRPLAAASYAAGLMPFTFVECEVQLNGSQIASARKAVLTCARNLKNDRWALNRTSTIREQLRQGKTTYVTQIDRDFDDDSITQLLRSKAQVSTVMRFDNGTESLVFTGSGQLDGSLPSLNSEGLEEHPISVVHSHATADASVMSAVLINSEVTAT